MEFKELDLEDLINGYICSHTGEMTCIFCGEKFEKDLIYNSRNRLVTGKRAMLEHICDIHGSIFEMLIGLDKQVCGLSDTQKQILEGMFEEKDNKMLSEEMGINIATVRTHKFNLQKMKREAKILLTLIEHIENEELAIERKKLEGEVCDNGLGIKLEKLDGKREYVGNRLHPFFSSFDLK